MGDTGIRSLRSSTASPPATVRDRLRFRIRRGLDLDLPGAADARTLEEGAPVSCVAVLGADAPGIRPELRVAVGDRVAHGGTLFVDRRRPEIRVTAPGAGRVVAIERGHRRRLEAIVIRLEGDEAQRFELTPVRAGGVPAREAVRQAMLASGLWASLRTRPFSRIPDAHAVPRSIFVTAMESDPLAPAVEAILGDAGEDFARGVAALAALTDGPVRVCSRPGAALPLPDVPRVERAEFEGPHPAGLPGTHIHLLDPVDASRTVWHVAYPDVQALGALLVRGRLPTARVVALTGPAMARPRLVRTRPGASTEELLHGELGGEPCRVISGSVLSGRTARGHTAFLGRSHTQLCAVPEASEPSERVRGGWRLPGRGARAAPSSTSLGGRRDAFLPLERLEAVVPLDLLVVPLLRALLVGDVDAARELGCLELAEEDLALVTFLCPSKLDHGALLRGVLDEIEKEEA